jgi:putative acetyltransferase
MPTALHFRWATAADADALGDVMFDSVRNGESPYSEAQRSAWVPVRPAGEAWAGRLRGQDVILAEEDGEPVGFMTLGEGGYVDLAFIRPRARGSGLFRQLLSRLTERAVARGEPRLWTHASLMAEPAFAKLGFALVRRERVRVGDQELDRCEMERRPAEA